VDHPAQDRVRGGEVQPDESAATAAAGASVDQRDLRLLEEELGRAGLQVRTSDYGAFCRDIAVLARHHGIRLREVLPADESLESVFAYLVAG